MATIKSFTLYSKNFLHSGCTSWNVLCWIGVVLEPVGCKCYPVLTNLASLFACRYETQVNISLNSVAAGMDLTSVLPASLSAKRGGLLLAFVGFVCCPWNFVNSPGTFVTVLSSFGLFVSPLIGIYVADFWVVRKCNWRVPDLYVGDNRSVYWYTGGWHWRGFVCWLGIIWLSLRELFPLHFSLSYITAYLTCHFSWFRGRSKRYQDCSCLDSYLPNHFFRR